MHARIGTLYPHPDRFDHVLRVLHDTVFPASQKEPGFRAMLVMNNRHAGTVVIITLWESEADMLASEAREYLQDQVSRIITHLRRPPEFEHYETEVL